MALTVVDLFSGSGAWGSGAYSTARPGSLTLSDGRTVTLKDPNQAIWAQRLMNQMVEGDRAYSPLTFDSPIDPGFLPALGPAYGVTSGDTYGDAFSKIIPYFDFGAQFGGSGAEEAPKPSWTPRSWEEFVGGAPGGGGNSGGAGSGLGPSGNVLYTGQQDVASLSADDNAALRNIYRPLERNKGGFVPSRMRGPQLHMPDLRKNLPDITFKGGLFDSPVAGRTDRLNRKVPGGSYVIPADVVSALGEGNTMAGSTILERMFQMPHGVSKPKGMKAPRGPKSFMSTKKFASGGNVEPAGTGYREAAMQTRALMDSHPMRDVADFVVGRYMESDYPGTLSQFAADEYGPDAPIVQEIMAVEPAREPFARGGSAEDDGVPVVVAGGEFLVPPEVVEAIGSGDIERGHKILTKFVLKIRKDNIAKTKKLKPPKE